MQTVFVNPERCIGCLQCELACAVEHSASQDAATAFLEVPVPRKRVHVEPGPMPTLAFPNRCRHCDPAPCLQVCPSGAITREDELGVVLVEPKRCIGCAMQASGPGIYFQTAQASLVGDLQSTILWAISEGANDVELPSGYASILSAAQLAADNQALGSCRQ